MRPVLVVVGLVLLAVGIAGVRYAPVIVAVQHRESMTPLEDEPLADEDRTRVTRGVGLLFILVGLALLVYGTDVPG